MKLLKSILSRLKKKTKHNAPKHASAPESETKSLMEVCKSLSESSQRFIDITDAIDKSCDRYMAEMAARDAETMEHFDKFEKACMGVGEAMTRIHILESRSKTKPIPVEESYNETRKHSNL